MHILPAMGISKHLADRLKTLPFLNSGSVDGKSRRHVTAPSPRGLRRGNPGAAGASSLRCRPGWSPLPGSLGSWVELCPSPRGCRAGAPTPFCPPARGGLSSEGGPHPVPPRPVQQPASPPRESLSCSVLRLPLSLTSKPRLRVVGLGRELTDVSP